MAVSCPSCGSEELGLVEVLEDSRRRLRCESCNHEWLRGETKAVYKTANTVEELRLRFPSPDDVDPETRERVLRLKDLYLAEHPDAVPEAVEFREKYRRIFSQEGLREASPSDLKYFANSNLAGNPGNMSVFNNAWNELGDEAAAQQVRDAVDYLLYGESEAYIENRLTHLIEGRKGFGMIGFREALLTKVLCMVEPQRFLPIIKYTGQAGKKEIAKLVYGLDLPRPEATSWTIGRLIFWSNDLLVSLAGDGFADTEHMAGFLWWAKDQRRTELGIDSSPADDVR